MTRNATMAKLEAKFATLPSPRDMVHRCFICGEDEERLVEGLREESGRIVDATVCSNCSHTCIIPREAYQTWGL